MQYKDNPIVNCLLLVLVERSMETFINLFEINEGKSFSNSICLVLKKLKNMHKYNTKKNLSKNNNDIVSEHNFLIFLYKK